MVNNQKVVVVIPAYNTEKTLAMTLQAIPRHFVDDILVIDDGSRDGTSEVAKKNGARVMLHPQNRGYGATQKTGYQEALRIGANIVVMVHSDFQYDPTLIPSMIKPILAGEVEACFGSRMFNKKDARQGGMPLWRFIPNIGLTLIEDFVLRLGLTEYHTGYRAYARRVLETIPFAKNSDNYVFDTEMIVELKIGRFRVAEIPIPTRYAEDSQSPSFAKSVQYGVATIGILIKYILHKVGLKLYSPFIMNSYDSAD